MQFKAKALRGSFRRATRTLDFEVEAEQQGHDPCIASMSLVQSPTIPGAAIFRVLTVAALLFGLAAAWFSVIRPEIREAATDIVDERIAELSPEFDDRTAPVPATTAVDDDAAIETANVDVSDGEPSFIRLTVDAPILGTADASQPIGEGITFDMTDIRVENSLNDAGIAQLFINGVQVFQWSLSNIRGQYFEPRITPIRLQPGDNLTFSVRCDAKGTTSTADTCSTRINIGGRTRPAQ